MSESSAVDLGGGQLLLVVVVGLILVLGPITVMAGPFVRDDWLLDRIVRAVALDWRDFGRDRARARLEYELDHNGIGLHVRDDDCTLVEEPSGVRRVTCAWEVRFVVPASGMGWPLSFGSEASIGTDGDLLP